MRSSAARTSGRRRRRRVELAVPVRIVGRRGAERLPVLAAQLVHDGAHHAGRLALCVPRRRRVRADDPLRRRPASAAADCRRPS